MLEGRWSAQGGYYEFVKDRDEYEFAEYGAVGRTGTGRARIKGDRVTLDVNNAWLGRYTLQLRLQGDTMQGTLNVMGMPMPLVLTRG